MKTETLMQECITQLEKFNERGLAAILTLITDISNKSLLKNVGTDELKEWEQEKAERAEQERKRTEERTQTILKTKEQLKEWEKKHCESVDIPDRYDMTSSDMGLVCNGLLLETDPLNIWYAAEAIFSYGFKKGCSYTKNRQKKAIKKATA